MFMFFCVVGITIAQRTVTGTLMDTDGETLIGANVLAKGSSIGTITDIDGTFIINVPDGVNTLVVSYTGYETKEIDITGLSQVTITLAQGQLLEEIVIAAQGITRNARDVVYANQTVGSDELLSTPNKNTLEALRGKVAGVRLTTGSGSVGASTRIVLRGEGSLTGDNNALIVVDGIPIDNSSSIRGQGSASAGYTDFGNRFNDINPNDIESVTILKGPSATSLYGSRGASGVILVTTKSGKGDKSEITFNSSASVENAYVLLQRQDRYGQGYGPPFTSGNFLRDSGENWSWGPEFDGVVRPWTSPVDSDGDGNLEYLSRPYSAVPNQIENFFRQGSTFTNSIGFSGSNDKFNYYTSYSNLSQDGTLDNTSYDRNTFKFAGGAKLSEKLSANFSVNYSNVKLGSTQEGRRPFEGQNAYANAIQSPVNIPLNELRDYNSPFHDFGGYYGSYTTNPYFILNEYVNDGTINNTLGNFSLSYNLMEGLNLTGKIGANIVSTGFDEATPNYAYEDHYIWEDDLSISLRGGRQSTPGEYKRFDGTTKTLDITVGANYTRQLSENFSLNSAVGFNNFTRDVNNLDGTTVGGLVVPGFYNLSNSVQAPLSSQFKSEYEIRGLYGNFSIGWQDKVFLEYSARNDWSSTLPSESNSFFYQAVGVSAVVSDLLNISDDSAIDFLKARLSFGTTGKDTDPYNIRSVFVGNPVLQELSNGHDLTFPLNGQPGFTVGNSIGNPDLRPELTTTFEAGIDASLWQDKVSLAYTFYNSNHSDQLVQVSLPASSGFTSTLRNVGEITNTGHELSLGLKPFYKRDGFKTSFNIAFATNDNKVVKVSDEQTELTVGGFSTVSIVAEEGLPYGSFKGTEVRRDDQGRIIVGADGLPLIDTDLVNLGSYQPDWTGSLASSIGWKNISFNFLVDVRRGGKFLSLTKDLLEFNGTALTTLIGDRGTFVVENSVLENPDGSLVENTIETNPYDFIRNQPFSTHLIDGSFVKLRELGLTYQFPNSMLRNMKIKDLSVSLFASNVKFWLPAENTFADPEVNGAAGTGNGGSIETTQTPPSQSFGARLSVRL